MRANDKTITYYSTYAKKFYRTYKKLQFEQAHAIWFHLIPTNKKSQILDVGAGSGRDASWFAQNGHEVTAVEPADGLRELAQTHHAHDHIRWIADRLPELQIVKSLNLEFDLILLSAVWMHIHPKHRKEAFDNLVYLLSINGKLVITLRSGPSRDNREMHPVEKKALLQYAEDRKLELLLDNESVDVFGRHDVKWETVVFKRV